jgi:hypothetical protein
MKEAATGERNALFEKLSKMIKRGRLHITDLSTKTRLELMAYDAAKRERQALGEGVKG